MPSSAACAQVALAIGLRLPDHGVEREIDQRVAAARPRARGAPPRPGARRPRRRRRRATTSCRRRAPSACRRGCARARACARRSRPAGRGSRRRRAARRRRGRPRRPARSRRPRSARPPRPTPRGPTSVPPTIAMRASRTAPRRGRGRASSGRPSSRRRVYSCSGCSSTRATAPFSHDLAPVDHEHRSATHATTPRSWVMKSMREPRARRAARCSSSSTAACTETSSAEVISSQMSRSGCGRERAGDRDPLALAAGELAREAVASARRQPHRARAARTPRPSASRAREPAQHVQRPARSCRRRGGAG